MKPFWMGVFVLCPHNFYSNPKGFSNVFGLIRYFFSLNWGIKLMKRAVHKGIQNDMLTQCDYEMYAQRICRNTEDHMEGVQAFVEKREPKFRGI